VVDVNGAPSAASAPDSSLGRPLELAMASNYLPSDSKIGAGAQAHGLAEAMARRGHHVTMFSPCGPVAGASYAHVHLPLEGSMRTFRWAGVLRGVDLTGFDVLHSHGDDHLLVGRRRPPQVRTIHGSCFSEARHIAGAKERSRMLLLGVCEVAATFVADAAVPVSEATRRWYPWVRGVIPCGVDLERFHPGHERAPVPTILFVGTYERRKRGRLLLEAFTDVVRPRLPDARLWMVCSDAPSAPGVDVLGWLGDDELADRYRRAWAFCLPSSYEGFGVPYVEALASGLPVVATPNPGAEEVLRGGELGVLADPASLGDALVSLLEDDGRRRELEVQGLAAARSSSWEQVAVAYEHVYAELLAHAPRRRTRAGTAEPEAGG
jgi:glycosyltransferase involved in cell wall biosynthesis